ncbi:MAG: DUF2914 domain-containing protein [Acidobacteria bacterium]|nr:DUF2914 domain-containing protein [Acidobacteriota bacterium]MCG3190782.1 hypothetical protein [Thermoanaerobaculia bacterium]
MHSLSSLKDAIRRHEKVLWWLHSAWALLFGILFMWLGAKNFTYLRVAVFHLAFIWVASLFLPVLLGHPRLAPAWAERLRLAINYFSKNFFQQVAFFVLPLYHKSATYPSRNTLFMALLAVSAVLSTLDTVYDDHISKKWHLIGLFLAFNIFASFNVMFPVLFQISNTAGLTLSAALSALVFASLTFRHAGFSGARRYSMSAAGALLVFAVALLGRRFVPPAPLTLASGTFGTALAKGRLEIAEAVGSFAAGSPSRLYFLSAVRAPMGLSEKINHVWYAGGRKVYESRLGSIVGGRAEGYRYWSTVQVPKRAEPVEVEVQVLTQGGQLIGRSRIE